MTTKLMSWNVNGIRAATKKGFSSFVDEYSPDVLCLQEVRATQEQHKTQIDGYYVCWNAAIKKGYAGTALYSKVEPVNVETGLGSDNEEGRVITAEFADYFVVTVYTPNSKRGLLRLDYRTQEWDIAFLKHVKDLEKTKPVIFCGDLNVAHKEIDLANPKANKRNAGFTNEERASFDNIIEAGFIDTFREFTTEGEHYSWWSNFNKARDRNIGWRIDYFCISSILRKHLVSAKIHADVFGSDHCPISIELDQSHI